jgi:hypothetical protein
MRNLIRGTVIGGALALFVAGGAFAKPEVVRVGNLALTHDGGISPTELPKRKQAPVKAFISATIATIDGSHPPAAREARIDLDKDIHVNAKGLPVCKAGQLNSRNTAAARQVCGDAVVGAGLADVRIAFPEQPPLVPESPLTMFNGGVKGGKTTIFIHAYITVPVPAAIVTRVELTPRPGRYGTHVVAKIPVISGGAGSLTMARLNIGRKFTYKGKKTSYLTASCPTGRHSIKGRVSFADATVLNLSRALPCTATN